MLMPKKVKFRKMQKGNMNGKAYSGVRGVLRRVRSKGD